MKKVTIALDEETAAWVRVRAARLDLSVSRFVSEVLRERMHEAREYESAMRRYLALEPLPLKGRPERYLSREEAHERKRVR
jgi:hypothetical protein